MIQQSPTERADGLPDNLAEIIEDELWSWRGANGGIYAIPAASRAVAIKLRAAALSQAAQPAEADGIPADIAEHVRKIGRVEWGQTPAHDAEGHGRHVADSVRMTAAHFGQTEDQHMHGLWLEGTETVLCHTGTSPNAPMTTRALVGAWNWLVDQSEAAATPKAPATDAGEVERAAERVIRALLGNAHRNWDADPIQETEREWARPIALAALATPPAPNDDVRAALEWIDYHKDDQDMNHVNFRIGAGSRARDALAALKENRRG